MPVTLPFVFAERRIAVQSPCHHDPGIGKTNPGTTTYAATGTSSGDASPSDAFDPSKANVVEAQLAYRSKPPPKQPQKRRKRAKKVKKAPGVSRDADKKVDPKKPDKKEYSMLLKISGLGIAVIGLIALVEDGDEIVIDASERTVTLNVGDDVLAERRKAWTPPQAPTRGVLGKYARLVASASQGAITDGD